MSDNTENAFLEAMRRLFATDDPDVLVGGGPDDCAHLVVGPQVAVSVDAFVEGSHFLPDAAPEDVANKVFGASLSDLAASACEPRWVLLTACFRKGLAQDWPARYAAQCALCAKQYGITIVGGDTITGKGSTCLTAAVFGPPMAGGPVLRSSAKPGDVLAVTGKLGGSILGGHLSPVPRFAEMRLLLQTLGQRNNGDSGMGAAMDISDGLALDLSRMCRESDVGAVVEDGLVPIAAEAFTMAKNSGKTPLEHAYSDGEDFELLVTMRPGAWEYFQQSLSTADHRGSAGKTTPFTKIGSITGEKRLLHITPDGERAPMTEKGFEHTW